MTRRPRYGLLLGEPIGGSDTSGELDDGPSVGSASVGLGVGLGVGVAVSVGVGAVVAAAGDGVGQAAVLVHAAATIAAPPSTNESIVFFIVETSGLADGLRHATWLAVEEAHRTHPPAVAALSRQ
jgi:hypothetical protein